MSVKNFIPRVWSTRLVANLNKNLVYGDLVNKEYEGEIKGYGDSIVINQMGQIAVRDYTGTLGEPDDVTSTQVIMLIDKAKEFQFNVKDVDKAQSNINLVNEMMKGAARSVQTEVDKEIAALVSKAAIKVGTSAAPIELTVANAYDKIVDLSVELDKKNVSQFNRFIVLPSEIVALLEKDARFTRSQEILESGVADKVTVAGFEIRKSENMPVTAGKYSIMAGTKDAVAFAGQVDIVETNRAPTAFADTVRGLYVFGAKVIQPDALVKFVAQVKVAE